METQMSQCIVDVFVFFCTMFSFLYGVIKFFKKGKPLYLQIIACGIGCMMLGKLFEVVTIITGGQNLNGFHVGILGTIGCFMFFFSANFGQMDSLVDSGKSDNWKYRIVALLAPLLLSLGCITIGLSKSTPEMKVVCIIEVAVIMQASYFNLKHLIIPDVEDGIIKSIRSYNFFALLYAVICVADIIFQIYDFWTLEVIASILFGVVSVLMILIVERGVKKWTI